MPIGRLLVNAADITHVHSHCLRSIYCNDNECSGYKNADNIFTTSVSNIVSRKRDKVLRGVVLRKASGMTSEGFCLVQNAT